MDAEFYVAEIMARSRIAEAQARAEIARLLHQSKESSKPHDLGRRLIETGRSLVKRCLVMRTMNAPRA